MKTLTTKEFMKLAFQRLGDNLLSVKVWMILWPFFVSTWLLKDIYETQFKIMQSLIPLLKSDPKLICELVEKSFELISNTFTGWLTFNVSLVGTIVVVREIFKVPRVTDDSNEENGNGG
jgi:hypothetical protein